ncbi:hypothetical protein BDB01DRAFT_903165 [Pilobolus umbonatus]|nr:hypothetical protein BDB01DRAFT_903165 [Pilobolus umbonatus]
MPDRQCSTPATPEDGSSLKRSFDQYSSLPRQKLTETYRRKRLIRIKNSNTVQPRWHNQSFMLFLALRQNPDNAMSRIDLIRTAIELDKKISEERFLPKIFRGKTPMNSASAILTNNTDRYFVPFKPYGSRSMHFKLSFKPGNFDDAYGDYLRWESKLIQSEWPRCFGVKKMKKEDVKPLNEYKSNYSTDPAVIQYPTEFDEFIANRKKAREKAKEMTMSTSFDFTMNDWIDMSNEPCDLDTTHVPKSWRDILSLRDGIVATRRLPKNAPLGFYFGVPMTEDEFDSLKDGVGYASEYSIMYQKMVLDPTDTDGSLYYINGEPLCPFHLLHETSDFSKANIILYESHISNQIICCTKRVVECGEELLLYSNVSSGQSNWDKQVSVTSIASLLNPIT